MGKHIRACLLPFLMLVCIVVFMPLYLTVTADVSIAGDKVDLKPVPINEPLLVDILNNSERHEPSIPDSHQWPTSPGGVMTPFLVKLYSIPVEGSCIPETHMICSHRYYLAVGDYGMDPLKAVFHLGEVGEIVGFKWENTPNRTAILNLEVQNYPTHAFKWNPKLQKVIKSYIIQIYIEKIFRLKVSTRG